MLYLTPVNALIALQLVAWDQITTQLTDLRPDCVGRKLLGPLELNTERRSKLSLCSCRLLTVLLLFDAVCCNGSGCAAALIFRPR